ncbi:MAG: DUF1992 domain-containing protein [Zoogloeaceae bacterium]|nr:DUF1992 domain-containing protein [Zoogloeaceae bacterium]
MKVLDTLIEQRIAAAEARGEFRDLPGCGQPQYLEENPLIPAELRLMNRILKNAGFVPPAVTRMKEAGKVRHELVEALKNGNKEQQCQLQARLLALELTLESTRGAGLRVPQDYRRQVAEKLAGEKTEEHDLT